ncbi:hypothetical protein L211DRAFT_124525 [Terfezia boudieri ATCC MYA-4762]|uniref:Uncharacterized protein n=1 Tax=Terfezia boudieri ATCC MYA-4762 TaxID=1051890 RepID=A0A3N4LR65_9PEZI|nr:hypothetical protein L211DRAFT_124525 [Terfezia boudieri ATCC MYA-4762]
MVKQIIKLLENPKLAMRARGNFEARTAYVYDDRGIRGKAWNDGTGPATRGDGSRLTSSSLTLGQNGQHCTYPLHSGYLYISQLVEFQRASVFTSQHSRTSLTVGTSAGMHMAMGLRRTRAREPVEATCTCTTLLPSPEALFLTIIAYFGFGIWQLSKLKLA